jgi:hypothetical protein
MSPSLMDAATRGPQVQTLGDAFALMRQRKAAELAQQQAAALNQQQLTLGNIHLDQARRDQEADERGRKLFAPDPEETPAPAAAKTFDTALSPSEEKAFAAWKKQYAPNDSGADYDLRGAFKAGLKPDPTSGHWPDTFKKPNHPTFSDQSKYAKDAPEKAGTWNGETYIPAQPAAPTQMSAPAPAAAPSFENGAPVMRLGDVGKPQPAAAPVAATPAPTQQQAPAPAPRQPRPRPTAAAIYGAYGPVKGAAIVKAMNEADEIGLKQQSAKNKQGDDLLKYEGSLASMVKAADYSADAVEQAMHMLEDHGFEGEAANIRAHLQQNPGSVKDLIDRAIAASPDAVKLQNENAKRGEEAAAAKRAADLFPDQQTKAKYDAVAAGADADAKTRANAATQLAAAAAQGPAAVAQVLDQMPYKTASVFVGAKTPAEILARGLTANEQTNAAETKKRDDRSAAHMGRIEANEATRTGIAVEEHQRKMNGALGILNPNARDIARKLAVGDFDPALLGRMPDKEAIVAGAIEINPGWTPQIYSTKKSFTDPEKREAKNLETISRIVGHIGRFESNSKEMGTAPLYALGVNVTGGQNKLNNDAHAISAELEKLVSGGVGAVGQVQKWHEALRSPSEDARQQAIDEISQLIGSQYEGMNQSYKAAIGQDIPMEKYVSPAGRAWMQQKGIKVNAPDYKAAPAGTVRMIAPNGQEQDVAADQVAHFEQLGAKKVGQ